MEEISQLSRSGGWQDWWESRKNATIPKEFAVGRIFVRRRDARVVGGTSEGLSQRALGHHSEVERLSNFMVLAQVAAPTDCIIAVHPCAHGEVTSHQCGLNGVRVGEAAHPGPRLFQGGKRVLCCHPIGMLFLAFHLLPIQHNWLLRRTLVPIVGGGEEPSVRFRPWMSRSGGSGHPP